jgi:hypothetical protein
MSTGNSANRIQPNSTREFVQELEQDVVPPVDKRGCHGAVMRENFGRRLDEFGASFRECWRRMRVMHAAFEQSGNGSRSRERSEERLREEEAWSRMNDEGCPNGTQQPYPRQDTGTQQPYPRQDTVREDGGTGPVVPAPRI